MGTTLLYTTLVNNLDLSCSICFKKKIKNFCKKINSARYQEVRFPNSRSKEGTPNIGRECNQAQLF